MLAAGAIASVHALALYALVVVAPAVRPASPSTPLAVRFVSSVEPRARPELPPVTLSRIVPAVDAPQMPLVEVAIAEAPPARAITVSHSMPTPSSPAEQGAPKLVHTVEYVREPTPRYPVQSRRMREEGLVVLRVLIDENGRARSIDIETSSGFERLDHAAREAVSAAVFRPYMEDGAPRSALVLIPIEFALGRAAA